MEHAGISTLRDEFLAMFDRVFEAGQHHERQQTQRVLSNLKTMLDKAQSGDAASLPAAEETKASPSVPPDTKREGSYPQQRAKSGSVLKAVEGIVREAHGPLGPLEVVRIARKDGSELNASSVRMALRTLQKNGVIESTGRAEWQMKRTTASAQSAEQDDLPYSHDNSRNSQT